MDIDETRRFNICELEKIHGTTLAKKAGMSPTQYYNLRDGAKDSKTGKPRGMRKETAWKLEDAAGVERGYLDVLHDEHNVKNTTPIQPALNDVEKHIFELLKSMSVVSKNQVLEFVKFKLQSEKNMQDIKISKQAKNSQAVA